MALVFADLPEALENSLEIAPALEPRAQAGQIRRCRRIRSGGADDRAGPARARPLQVSRNAERRFAARQTRHRQPTRVIGPPRQRTGDDLPDGLRGLLPDRRGLHPLGTRERRAGGPGPRLRRRLAGRLCAADHRSRPAALRPAVRALPEPGTRLDARLRRRFLHGGSRPGHRLRGGTLRPRSRIADHHLRHYGGEGGGPRRRARAGAQLRLCRQHRQADSRSSSASRSTTPCEGR